MRPRVAAAAVHVARGPLDPRVAGETDDLPEVGDAADAAAERALTDPMDAVYQRYGICRSFTFNVTPYPLRSPPP